LNASINQALHLLELRLACRGPMLIPSVKWITNFGCLG
jgi:hypothetical protein